jgi:Flp pilus assembly protein TadG
LLTILLVLNRIVGTLIRLPDNSAHLLPQILAFSATDWWQSFCFVKHLDFLLREKMGIDGLTGQFIFSLRQYEVNTVTTKSTGWHSFSKRLALPQLLGSRLNRKGQAMVEFSLTFVLLLVIAWIPADFGLAFFTGQQVQNAAREGARIAAVDPFLLTQLGGNTTLTCAAPCSGQINVLQVTAARLSNVLLRTTNITLTYPASGAGCNQMLTMQVQGTYNYFFYQLLHLLGATNDLNTVTITRTTTMRYEHQIPACAPFPT